MHTYVSINKVACHPLPTREYADVLYARTCYGTREPVTGGEGVAATPIIGPRVNQTPVRSCFVHGPQLVYPCADDSVVAVRRWAGVDNKATVGFFCCPQSSFPFKDSSRPDCAHQHIVGSSGWSINVFIIDSIYIYIPRLRNLERTVLRKRPVFCGAAKCRRKNARPEQCPRASV